MTLMLFLGLMWAESYHFVNVDIYDVSVNAMREGVHFKVDEHGVVGVIADRPLPESPDHIVIKGATILPHLSDFYSLVQERGLGRDEDINRPNQGRMVRYLHTVGIRRLRDPVFPPEALVDGWRDIDIYAARGYLDVPDGPGAAFGLVLDPQEPLEAFLKQVPPGGPVTLWWTSNNPEKPVVWPAHATLLRRLMTALKARGQKVGAYIQDADDADVRDLFEFDFDFYEGMPHGLNPALLEDIPLKVIWAPLVALNDKRYCARKLDARLTHIAKQGLYDRQTLKDAQGEVDRIMNRIRERCLIWRKRRENSREALVKWLEAGRPVAVGSAGGHLFSFTGEIRLELDTLSDLGATQPQLLQALFNVTPTLLNVDPVWLKSGRPANFIVYRKGGFWGNLIGENVDLNYINGRLYDPTRPVTLESTLP